MNKTLLLTGVAVLISYQAMAAQDITGAFAVPGKGQISSDTRIGMTRANTKLKIIDEGSFSYAADGLYIEEEIEYGITDQFSVNAGIANVFDKDRPDLWSNMRHLGGDTNTTYNNDHNFMYNVGAKYNTSYEDALFQVAVDYTTWNPHDFYGHHSGTGNDWQKNLGLDLKAGLDLGNGLTPYIVYHIDGDIDVAHRELTQSVSVGVHKYTGKWALDGAIRYEWTKGSEIVWGDKKKSWLALLFGFLMGISRIYLVVHYPSDVVGGILTGTFGGLLGIFLAQHLPEKWYMWDFSRKKQSGRHEKT